MAEINAEAELDMSVHPADVVPAGELSPFEKPTPKLGLAELRKAIPEHCFERSYLIPMWTVCRDVAISLGLMYAAYAYIPKIEHDVLRWSAWALYGFTEGLMFTGLWILGHECGHMSFSPSAMLNDTVGFIVQSALLTPYHSWKSTHRRHHIHANNLSYDHNYVPPQREAYVSSLMFSFDGFEELVEDSPIMLLLRLVLQSAIGFPFYLLTNITAAPGSHVRDPSKKVLGNSHFAPTGSLFRDSEASVIFLADLGVAAAVIGLCFTGQNIGLKMLALTYLQPYFWMNHWLVTITYLNHTHPESPKYEDEAWTFLKGATATIDRDFGWIGLHIFHGIIEHHVVHHLFPRIPFYHTAEATKAIVPLLGNEYINDKGWYLGGLWEAFTKCRWVEPDNPAADVKDRTMWYKSERIATLKGK
ncbi:MAG: hypothetical protein ASARMPRED_008799 [Alectoria sarmentosa]|nr:MAG: hypothetical protein ASARMPRED_008799 [Alectoria sarmentosa]